MSKKPVFLLDTCLAAHLYNPLIKATRTLLERLHVEVLRPKTQPCCGLVAFNAGYFAVAKEMAKRFISTFWDQEYPIVIPSGSCAAMVRHHYKSLFKAEPLWEEKVHTLAKRTFELTEFLSTRMEFPLSLRMEGRVLFHPSCQALRLLQIHQQPIELLSKIRGIEPVGDGFRAEGWDRCCGFGGLFHLKYPEISKAMRDSKLELMERQDPQIIVGIDMGCLLHLKRGLKERASKIRVMHMAELLLEAGR
jgi:L-lactate dehydrogenase complex protein LldE